MGQCSKRCSVLQHDAAVFVVAVFAFKHVYVCLSKFACAFTAYEHTFRMHPRALSFVLAFGNSFICCFAAVGAAAILAAVTLLVLINTGKHLVSKA